MTLEQLHQLLHKVAVGYKETNSYIKGTIKALTNTTRKQKTGFAMVQAQEFKALYMQTLAINNDRMDLEAQIKILKTLLQVFAIDHMLTKDEAISALNIIRIVTVDPKRNKNAEEWTYDELVAFLENPKTFTYANEVIDNIINDKNESKALLPILLKYATAMFIVDGEINEAELKYLNELESKI